MSEVFIVLIGHKTLHSSIKVGAVLTGINEAAKEVERLRNANGYTDAWFISREVENPEAKHLAALNKLCDKLEDEVNGLIDTPKLYDYGDAVGVVCKLFDAIRDIEECDHD